jgi:hypothetical protein
MRGAGGGEGGTSRGDGGPGGQTDGGASDGGASDGGSASPEGGITALPTPAVTCASATPGGAAASGTDPIDADTLGTPGGDTSRQYSLGSPVQITFTTRPSAADTVSWSLQDAWQTVWASGQFGVGVSPATTVVTCTSTLAGYFAITATLVNAGAELPSLGTRPAGIATFGVLPELSSVLPAVTFPHMDDHRFGLEGSAYVDPPDAFNPFLRNLGASWIIDGRAWSTTEPNGPGAYDPATYTNDPTYGDAVLLSDGAIPLMDMSGIPGWANSSGQTSAQYLPTSLSDYQSYMSQVGQERAGAIATYKTLAHDYYQITWEPDPGTGNAWQGTDAQFVSMYQAAYEGLHGADPNAIVLGLTASGVSSDASMMTTMLAAGLGQYVDGWTFHGYYDAPDSWDTPPEDTSWGTELYQQIRTLRHLMAANSPPHAKLIQSEMGIRYPVDGQYGAGYPSQAQLAEQGAVVARAHLINVGEGVDVDFFFYSADFPGDIGSGLNFDLVYDPNDASTLWGTGAISPKPGFMMAAALTRLVDGTVTLGYLDDLPAGVYGYAFQRLGGGAVITAMWTHAASWNATATYALPVAASGTSGQVVLVDSMGNPSPASYTDGTVSLSLGEYPVYVISNDAATTQGLVTVPEGYAPEL